MILRINLIETKTESGEESKEDANIFFSSKTGTPDNEFILKENFI